jgi:hypothetical protein
MSALSIDALYDHPCAAERTEGRFKALQLYEEFLGADALQCRTLLLGSNTLSIWGKPREATESALRAFASDSNEFSRKL